MTEQEDQKISRRQFLKRGAAAAAAIAVGGSLTASTRIEDDFGQEPFDAELLAKPYSEAALPPNAETREDRQDWNQKIIVDQEGHKLVAWYQKGADNKSSRFEFVWENGRLKALRASFDSSYGKFDGRVANLTVFRYNSLSSKRQIVPHLVAEDGSIKEMKPQSVSTADISINGKPAWSADQPELPKSQ